MLEINLRKYVLLEKYDLFFSARNSYFLTHCQDGNVYMYGTTEQLKNNELTGNSQNIKQTNGI